MKGRMAVVGVLTLVAAGCDSPVSPTVAPADRLSAQAAPFRNYGDSVPEEREVNCMVTWGCCSNPRPHQHCR